MFPKYWNIADAQLIFAEQRHDGHNYGYNKKDLLSTDLLISTKLTALHILSHLTLPSMLGKAGKEDKQVF